MNWIISVFLFFCVCVGSLLDGCRHHFCHCGSSACVSWRLPEPDNFAWVQETRNVSRPCLAHHFYCSNVCSCSYCASCIVFLVWLRCSMSTCTMSVSAMFFICLSSFYDIVAVDIPDSLDSHLICIDWFAYLTTAFTLRFWCDYQEKWGRQNGNNNKLTWDTTNSATWNHHHQLILANRNHTFFVDTRNERMTKIIKNNKSKWRIPKGKTLSLIWEKGLFQIAEKCLSVFEWQRQTQQESTHFCSSFFQFRESDSFTNLIHTRRHFSAMKREE